MYYFSSMFLEKKKNLELLRYSTAGQILFVEKRHFGDSTTKVELVAVEKTAKHHSHGSHLANRFRVEALHRVVHLYQTGAALVKQHEHEIPRTDGNVQSDSVSMFRA